jgi:hypothetical protein
MDGPSWGASTNLVFRHIGLYGCLVSGVRKTSGDDVRDAIRGLERSIQEVDLLQCAQAHCERSKPNEREQCHSLW